MVLLECRLDLFEIIELEVDYLDEMALLEKSEYLSDGSIHNIYMNKIRSYISYLLRDNRFTEEFMDSLEDIDCWWILLYHKEIGLLQYVYTNITYSLVKFREELPHDKRFKKDSELQKIYQDCIAISEKVRILE